MLPEFVPEHVQFHGPVPVTTEAVQAEQRFAEGASVKVAPLAVPQAPSAFFGAEQVAAVHPYAPEQVQSKPPSVPLVSVSVFVPWEQWFAVGYPYAATPSADPHEAFCVGLQRLADESHPYPEAHSYLQAVELADVE